MMDEPRTSLQLGKLQTQLDGLSTGQRRIESMLEEVRREVLSIGMHGAFRPGRRSSSLNSVGTYMGAASRGGLISEGGSPLSPSLWLKGDELTVMDPDNMAQDLDGERSLASAPMYPLSRQISSKTGAGGLDSTTPHLPLSRSRVFRGLHLRPHDALLVSGDMTAASSRTRTTRKGFLAKHSLSFNLRSKGRKYVPLHPTSWPRIVVDIIGFSVLLYDSIMVPYMLAWEVPTEGMNRILGWAAAAFWVLDIWVCANTGYIHDGKLVMNRSQILRRYARTGLVPDLVIVGVDLFSIIYGELITEEGSRKQRQQIQLLRAGRVAKIGRVVRVAEKLRQGLLTRLDQFMTVGLSKMGLFKYLQFLQFLLFAIKLAFFIGWLNHFGSCLWYWCGRNVPSDTGYSWIAELESDQPGLEGTRRSYLIGMYWAVTSMFSGSSFLTPSNTWESIFTQIYIICSALFVTSITSMLAAMLIQSQMGKQEQTNSMALLNKFLDQQKINPILSIAVRNQITTRLSVEKHVTELDIPLAVLSTSLRADLRHNQYCKLFQQHPFFRIYDSLDPFVVRELCFSGLQPKDVIGGEEILSSGIVPAGAQILLSGDVSYVYNPAEKDEEHRLTVKRSIITESMSEGQWLCELSLWLNWRSVGNAETHSPSSFVSLPTDRLIKVLSMHPDLSHLSYNYAKQLCEFLVVEQPEEVHDLSTGTDVDVLLANMPNSMRELVSFPLLELFKAHKHVLTSLRRRSMENLEDDIRSGKVHLMMNANMEVYKVEQVVQLHVLNPEGHVCVKYGEWWPRHYKVSIGLPSKTVRGSDDGWEGALEKLLTEMKELLSWGLELNRQETEVETRSRNSSWMSTRLIKRVQHATLQTREDAAEEFESSHENQKKRMSLVSIPNSLEFPTTLGDPTRILSRCRSMESDLEDDDEPFEEELGIEEEGSDAGEGKPRERHSWRPMNIIALRPGPDSGYPKDTYHIFSWMSRFEYQTLISNMSRSKAQVKRWMCQLTADDIKRSRIISAGALLRNNNRPSIHSAAPGDSVGGRELTTTTDESQLVVIPV